MKTVKLGKTDLEVTKLSLGGLFISDLTGDFEKSKIAAHCALDTGVRLIDTAPSYFNSETVLGNILKSYEGKNKPLISTKLGMSEPWNPKSKADIYASVKSSMGKLGVDCIDILFIHEPERRLQMDWWDDETAYDGPVMECLSEMKQKGMIRYTGVAGTCTHELAKIMDTGKFDCVLTAFNFSLLWREAEYEILPVAKKHNMGVICGSPLQQGALAVRRDEIIESGAPWISKPRKEQFKALYRLLDDTGINIVEMSMRFVISNPIVHCVLTGSRSKEEFIDNWNVVEKGPLPEDILKRLDEIRDMVPFRPTNELFLLPWGEDFAGLGWLH
ncbi:MAG: aldo/keto reductase [Synergistaceae bacterium]|nr:aldo/keto reductase [Synergistaceae bacterium]